MAGELFADFGDLLVYTGAELGLEAERRASRRVRRCARSKCPLLQWLEPVWVGVPAWLALLWSQTMLVTVLIVL